MRTSQTITNAEIRQLRREAVEDRQFINRDICDTALGKLKGIRGQVVTFALGEIEQARQICADILAKQDASNS